jgi:ATP adenylyltransferase
MVLQPGTLWKRIVTTTAHALSTGALKSFPTESVFIEDKGVRFFVRVLSALTQKDEERKKQTQESAVGKQVNPFLPPEKDLVVADLTDTHIAVLNKFNVVDHHLLIITRRFEEQEMLLTVKDFEALWLCMAEFHGLAFYNGGAEAGASQKHKHLQMVPLPLTAEGPSVPIASLLANAPEQGIGLVPGFSFLHAFARLDQERSSSPDNAAQELFKVYCSLLARVNMTLPSSAGLTRQSMPYCLLATREWMLLVPRSKEFFEDISLNSLAFVGSLYVRNAEQLERIRSAGPMSVLKSVAVALPG